MQIQEYNKSFNFVLTIFTERVNILFVYADVAELADALVLGTSTNGVEVQVLSSAPTTIFVELFESLDITKF